MEIIDSFHSSVPQILYKYRSWSDVYHKRLLTNCELYFPSPLKFNDPFDSCVALTPYGSKSDILLLGIELLRTQNPGMPYKEALKRAKIVNKEQNYRNEEMIKEQHRQMLESNYGVCSLTSDFDNLVMWSHYSNSHEGFCIGLDVDLLVHDIYRQIPDYSPDKLFLLCDEVIYYTDYPELWYKLAPKNNDTRTIDEIYREALQPLFAKSKQWEYEKEWRLITFQRNDLTLTFFTPAIKSIYLGCKMIAKHRAEILTIIEHRYPGLQVYQMKMKAKEFGLDYEQIL